MAEIKSGLSAVTGMFTCPCGTVHGYLPTVQHEALDETLYGEMICNQGCAAVGTPATDSSYDGPDGCRHTKITAADVAAANAYFAAQRAAGVTG